METFWVEILDAPNIVVALLVLAVAFPAMRKVVQIFANPEGPGYIAEIQE